MKRKPLTILQRVRIFDAANGVCHLCKMRIHAERGERWDVEHIKPLWLGGADEPSNMAPAHIICHGEKTKAETTDRAKSDRVRAKHLGIKARQSRPMPGTRASGIRKRMNRNVEFW